MLPPVPALAVIVYTFRLNEALIVWFVCTLVNV